jgi:hypothetical protein
MSLTDTVLLITIIGLKYWPESDVTDKLVLHPKSVTARH